MAGTRALACQCLGTYTLIISLRDKEAPEVAHGAVGCGVCSGLVPSTEGSRADTVKLARGSARAEMRVPMEV